MLGLVVFAASSLSTSVPAPAPRARSFEASYVATVQEVPAGLARLEGWIPVPSDSPEQTVRRQHVGPAYRENVGRDEQRHSE